MSYRIPKMFGYFIGATRIPYATTKGRWKFSSIKGCHSASIPLSRIIEEFSAYSGGQIDFSQDEESGLATICLNNPTKRNAMTGTMMVQLAKIVNKLENWNTGKALILHSIGDFFCSGGDLSLVKNISNSEGGMKMSRLMHDTLSRLSKLPLLSVAVVQGKSLGGGAELPLACDFRLLATNGTLQFVQVKMGTITGWGGGTRLVHMVGPRIALKLLLSCEKVSATEALRLGLADGILNDKEDILKQTKEWLTPFLFGAPEVIRSMKSSVTSATWLPKEKSFEQERIFFSSVWGGSANLKALQQNIKHR